MSAPPTRCCVLTQRGTRCANEPSPVRPSRMIGPVRLAACGLDGHQRALWSLPGFIRHEAYCGAFGCDRPSNAGICQKHRDMYRDFGITEHMLFAQEAPMTEPVTPPAAPQEAADGGAPLPPIVQPLDPGIAPVVDLLRAEGLSTTDSGDGYSKKEAIEAGEALDYAHVFIQVPEGERVEDIIANAKAIPWADYGYQRPTVELLARPECYTAANEPDIVAVHWSVGQLHILKPSAEVTEADFEPPHPLETRRDALVVRLLAAGFVEQEHGVDIRRFEGAGWSVPIPDSLTASDAIRMLDKAEAVCERVERQNAALPVDRVVTSDDFEPAAEHDYCRPGCVHDSPVAGEIPTAPGTDGESDGEPSESDIDDAYSGRWGQYAVGIDPATGKEHAAAYVVELVRPSDYQTTDALLSAIVGPRPIAPGPTVADLQAELAAERARADLCDAEAVSQRQRADAAEAQLRAIAEALDPEDSPTHDADDQPIPLPRRVEVALMPDPVYERELRKSLHAVEAELFEVDRALHTLGAYGTGPTKERLLQVLTPEDRRAILEFDAAEARMDLARLRARRLIPAPPERVAELVAKVATLDARIAALDAEKVQE